MENIKFALFSIIILALLAFLGYWAFSSIESGSAHLNNQELKTVTQENEDLKEEISNLKNKITVLESKIKEQTTIVPEPEIVIEKPKPVEQTLLKYQTLIDELQKLVTDNVFMKKGSQGPRVGTVQNFLNLYNKTSIKIDNDFGPSMETLIKKFQTDQKLTADGEVGPNTYKKMIDWLKKQ
jgi:peptidoglycan hydrolase-like protein with peptidoglycan-binding domain